MKIDKNILDNYLLHFLAEDIGSGDITSGPIFPEKQMGKGVFIAKQNFKAAGIDIAARVFTLQNPAVQTLVKVEEGEEVGPGDVLLEVSGPVIDLLMAERVALNLAQRLSGIATLTGKYVSIVQPLPVSIVDTRKTTPGLRVFEKYAVRVGGGRNHRFRLDDGVLIKDNHIAACGSIFEAVSRIRARIPHTVKIEVETESLEQVKECLEAGADIIMLDNMNIEMMKKAVKIVKGKAILEASGGVNLENVRAIAETGVNLISIGALTHSAPACDISMNINALEK